MLSRIGNSLFWMGRYMERAEHLARYAKVQYASSMDSPLAQSKDFVLQSILNMGGMYQGYSTKYAELNEDDVINYVAVDEMNPFSIQSCVKLMRENARGARDCISSELWETINRFYHDINKYSAAQLYNEGLHRFSQKVEENSSIMKGCIDNTLIRNEVWMLISLGIHLERAIQVTLIMLNKVYDINRLDPSKLGGPVENYQWSILLKSAESFDMYNRYYVITPTRPNALEFLIFNSFFPKSLAYNLEQIQKNILAIAFPEEKIKGSISFMAGKIASQFQYLTIEEVEDPVSEFLGKTLTSLYGLARLLEQKYLHF